VRELVTDYSNHDQSSLDDAERRLALHLTPVFQRRRLATITAAQVQNYVAQRRTDTYRVKQAVIELRDGTPVEVRPEVCKRYSNAQINRELALLKRMFNLQIELGKLAHKPHIALLKESNVRKGFFSVDEFEPHVSALVQAFEDVISKPRRSKGECSALAAPRQALTAKSPQPRHHLWKKRRGHLALPAIIYSTRQTSPSRAKTKKAEPATGPGGSGKKLNPVPVATICPVAPANFPVPPWTVSVSTSVMLGVPGIGVNTATPVALSWSTSLTTKRCRVVPPSVPGVGPGPTLVRIEVPVEFSEPCV
jgi:hypothetical protein